MEKKTYITPDIIMRKITMHSILAGSGRDIDNNPQHTPTGADIGWGKQGSSDFDSDEETGNNWGNAW